MAQRGCGWGAAGRVQVVTQMKDARFKRIVRPGEYLEIEVSLDEQLAEAYYLTGRVRVEDQLALRVSFACMHAKPGGAPA